jgi:hypothetical protein
MCRENALLRKSRRGKVAKIWIDGKLPAHQETRLVGGKGVMVVGLNNRGCTTAVILERTKPFRGKQIVIPDGDDVMVMDMPAVIFKPNQVDCGVMLEILKPEAEISMLLRNDSDEDKYFVAVIAGESL